MRGVLERLLGRKPETAGEMPRSAHESTDRGILVFEHTGEVIRAEEALKKAGLAVSVKGPPPDLRSGCDLVIEFPIVEELAAREILRPLGLEPKALPLRDLLLEPVSIFNVKDYGEYLLVRAANMKISVRKSDLRIVNISGGGCPDVPFLAGLFVGGRLTDPEEPRAHGQTLCGYALQLAFEEARRLCAG